MELERSPRHRVSDWTLLVKIINKLGWKLPQSKSGFKDFVSRSKIHEVHSKYKTAMISFTNISTSQPF